MKMYSSSICPGCKMFKDLIAERGIEDAFEIIDITEDVRKMREFLKLHTSQGYEEIEIPDLYLDYFKSLTTLSAERAINDKVIVHKGDTLMSLLQKYDGRKDILAKIQKACESAGLTLNMSTGIVE